MRWRVLDSGTLGGAEHMAVDAGLMDRARLTGETVLRTYQWERPTLSFGRHESVRDVFHPAVLAREQVEAVRRPTGGRVLLHHHEVTYSVTAPADDTQRLAEAFGRINAILVAALARLGVRAHASSGSLPRRPHGAACFAEPAAGELVVEGRKLVGSAQLRERGGLLQHGSILVEDDQPRIAMLATLSAVPLEPALAAATLRECLGRVPSYVEVRDALTAALEEAEGAPAPLDADEAGRFAAPYRERFRSAEWTWRR